MERPKVRFVIPSVGLLMCAAIAVAQVQPAAGSLAAFAEQAKEKGQQTATITWSDEPTNQGTLDEVLSQAALVLAVADGEQQQTVGTRFILTWRSFHVLHVLAPDPLNSKHQLNPEMMADFEKLKPLEQGHLAVPLLMGSAEVDGVRITLTSSDTAIKFVTGQRYLLLVALGPHGLAKLDRGAYGVFAVSAAERLSKEGASAAQFANEILSFGTIDKLEKHLKSAQGE